MRQPPATPPDANRSSRTLHFGRAFRRYFITGVATLFPVWATLFLLVHIFKIADRQLGQFFGWKIPGLGLLATILIILAVGMLSIHVFGRVVVTTIEGWFGRLPLVKKIYPPIKQLAQFLFTEGGRQAAFRRVVLVEYPRSGVYSLAFVTNEAATAAIGSRKTLLTLLIPTPPNPFTGPVIFVPKGDVIPLNLTVEDALKLVVSGGIVAPLLEAATHPKEPHA